MNRIAVALCALPVFHAAPLFAQRTAAAAGPEWWRGGGVCYEVFVRSFYDSDGDGIGDLRGLIEKLDYINDGNPREQRDLGASCIWLMPVAQSTSYHGYDVTNYYQVERAYGTTRDFQQFMAEARRRGIRVIVDLVPNHVSSEHPYFRSALLDAASPYRDWFVWSPTVRPASGWEAPVWHRAPTRDEYYYGLFWSGMPDLNLGNPAVTAELKGVARFWLGEMGVDGFRVDAARHLFEGEHGEWKHVPATHHWLRDYAAYIRRIAPDAFTIGEVWDSVEAILPYYPDQLDAYFMFDVGDAIIDAARTGSGRGLVASVQRVQRELPRRRWASFLRNHDQTRTLTDLRGDVGRARLAASLLLTLPGIPFVYYGEEIGMTGSKSDGDPRLRTPMHWARRPGVGFTSGTAWEPLHPDSFTANVEAQEADPASLLNHYRRLIHVRTANPALAAGDFVPLESAEDAAVAYLRRVEEQTVLVVANLGTRRLARVTLFSADAVLPAGRYAARPLLGGVREATLGVGTDGRPRDWTPAPALEPLELSVLELSRSN
ncbi:MAG: DUF3459 domain-containing protein [Gemmatimonadetes bacterium]|nr:DUF3459 domain-containing protein [Gemmatimonadota bacterium]